MDREQAKWVVFNSIKKKLKKLEPIDDIQELFNKETWRKNFIDFLYDNGIVLLAPPGIEFEEDKKEGQMTSTEEIIKQKKEALKKFTECYHNGEGDVIGGLLYMDKLKDEIKTLESK